MRANEIKHKVDWISLYEWQKTELDKRFAEYQQGNQPLHILDTVHELLRKHIMKLCYTGKARSDNEFAWYVSNQSNLTH